MKKIRLLLTLIAFASIAIAAPASVLINKAETFYKMATQDETMVYAGNFAYNETLALYKTRAVENLEKAINLYFKVATAYEKQGYKKIAVKYYKKVVEISHSKKLIKPKTLIHSKPPVKIDLVVNNEAVKIAKKKLEELGAIGLNAMLKKIIKLGKERVKLEKELLNNPEVAEQYQNVVAKEKALAIKIVNFVVKDINKKSLKALNTMTKFLENIKEKDASLKGLLKATNDIEKAIMASLMKFYVEDKNFADKLTKANIKFAQIVGYLTGFVSVISK